MNAYFVEIELWDNCFKRDVGLYNNEWSEKTDSTLLGRDKTIVIAVAESDDKAVEMMTNHMFPYACRVEIAEGADRVDPPTGHGMEIVEYLATLYPRYEYAVWDDTGKVLNLNKYLHTPIEETCECGEECTCGCRI